MHHKANEQSCKCWVWHKPVHNLLSCSFASERRSLEMSRAHADHRMTSGWMHREQPTRLEPVTPFAVALEPQEPRRSAGSSQPATKAKLQACVDPTLVCGALGRHLHGPNAAKHVLLVTYMRSSTNSESRPILDLLPLGDHWLACGGGTRRWPSTIASRPLIERWASTNRFRSKWMDVDGCGWTTGVGRGSVRDSGSHQPQTGFFSQSRL